MANCNHLFKEFNTTIKLNEVDRKRLINARNDIRDRIKAKFTQAKSIYNITENLAFQTQGSYIMDTIIKPIDDDFDIDDGIYFMGNRTKAERPHTTIFHAVILEALGKPKGNILEIIDKETCIRICYFGDFHIDLPIYYANNFQHAELAHKTDGWVISNPIEFIAWFEQKVKSGFQERFFTERIANYEKYQSWLTDIRRKDAQLRRIVRYMKAWANTKKADMPCGLIMTILATDRYKEDDRDDIVLYNLLTQLNKDLNKEFSCLRPTTPANENLFLSYSETKKNYFLAALSSFTRFAEMAINNPNQKEACQKWQKHLGERFPCHLAKNTIDGAKSYTAPAVIGDSSKSS